MNSASLTVVGALCLCASAAAQGVRSTARPEHPNFESLPVEGLRVAITGNELYALNTADHRLEIYHRDTLDFLGSVMTGLEPVAMDEIGSSGGFVLVSNRLSDSLTKVAVGFTVAPVPEPPRVVGTVYVGDEPADVEVFGNFAYVAVARIPTNYMPPTPASSWFENVVVKVDHTTMQVVDHVELDAHQPRALVQHNSQIYAVCLNSGNGTELLDARDAVLLGKKQQDPIGSDPPLVGFNPILFKPQIETGWGIIGTFPMGWAPLFSSRIVDAADRPGQDMFEIDPASMAVTDVVKDVGTTLFDIEVAPGLDRLWVTNTEAHNRRRFEPELRGDTHENRATVVRPSLGGGASFVEAVHALQDAQPCDLEFYGNSQDRWALIACLGTSSVVVLDAVTGALKWELDVPDLPVAIAADWVNHHLYVLSRAENSITRFDIPTWSELASVPLSYDPERASVRDGRMHLYEAREEAGHGNESASCASCHVAGNMDFLAWDLGAATGALQYHYPDTLKDIPSIAADPLGIFSFLQPAPGVSTLKGPMMTQTLRGLEGGEPFHWRGDRRFLQDFRGAFDSLLGGDGVSSRAMQEFAGFAREIVFPPSPFAPPDRDYLAPSGYPVGMQLFGLDPNNPPKPYNVPAGTGGELFCIDCHLADFPAGTNFHGDDARVVFDGSNQFMNVAQLRGVYEKDTSKALTGFGTGHDGRTDGVRGFFDDVFLTNFILNQSVLEVFPNFTSADRDAIADFVKAWDTGLHPLVGRMLHVNDMNVAAAGPFLNLAEAEAQTGEMDLVVKVWALIGTGTFGGVFDPASGLYRLDNDVFASRQGLLALALPQPNGQRYEMTFICVPPGNGYRLGIDRDRDFVLDGLEAFFGADPNDPDTDDDGYWDPQEIVSGTSPFVFNAQVPDASPPVVLDHGPVMVYVDSATIRLLANEPVTASVTATDPAGASHVDVSAELMLDHSLVLTGLPAGTPITYTIDVLDRNQNQIQASGVFDTRPMQAHVADIDLEVAIAVPPATGYGLSARVLVVDHTGAPVPGMTVRGVWESSAGTLTNPADWDQEAVTNTSGWAQFSIGRPGGGETVSFSPAYVGSLDPGNVFYVSDAVSSLTQPPNHFYFQPANEKNHVQAFLP